MDSAPRALCSLAGVESGRGTGLTESAKSHEVYVWYTYAGDDLDEGRRLGRPLLDVPGAVEDSSEVLTYPALQSITGEASGPAGVTTGRDRCCGSSATTSWMRSRNGAG
jgi:hypothetical protein